MVRKCVMAGLAGLASVITGCSSGDQSTGRVLGSSTSLGRGTVSSYAEFAADGTPAAIGVLYSAGALEGLPAAPSDGHHCYDRNGDGTVDQNAECLATHEFVLPVPDPMAQRDDVPFKWVLFNWNPVGHIPPGVYDVPHFDIHFYVAPLTEVFSIVPGPCGPEFVQCDQFAAATRPVPSAYIPAGYQNVDAVAPAMGNHLIDVTGPEFNGEKWARSWLVGTYDGHVTFLEEMLTRELLMSKPDTCYPLKVSEAVERSGYYPTQSCVRYDAQTDQYTVSMEGFVLREASAPNAATE
jgi:hypothetical protein